MSTSTTNPTWPPVVAVVGSGFCGTLVAVQLARAAGSKPMLVVLFERGERFARGVAYGTNSQNHLLNVPAGNMSALADEPDHFLKWLAARDPQAHAGTFAPRKVYGQYLEELLAKSASGSGAARIETVRDEVVDLRVDASGAFVIGAGGSLLRADRVVLAVGNARPQAVLACPDALIASRRYVGNPWVEGALEGLGRSDSLVLIGSGLSAVDLIADAHASGHEGPITVVSRHGLLPHPHQPAPSRPIAGFSEATPTAKAVLKHLRREAAACEQDGTNWRAVMDAVRPSIQAIWRGFNLTERKRFLRHLGVRWDVHRHRVAPQVDELVQQSRAAGRLEVIAGRLISLECAGDGVNVAYQRRGCTEPTTVFGHRVINCTGPSRDVRQDHSPLVSALLERGIGRTDPLSLGLETNEAGALVDRNGAVSGSLYTLGALLKGQLWETTAVRELRVQAADLARLLADSLPTVDRGLDLASGQRFVHQGSSAVSRPHVLPVNAFEKVK